MQIKAEMRPSGTGKSVKERWSDQGPCQLQTSQGLHAQLHPPAQPPGPNHLPREQPQQLIPQQSPLSTQVCLRTMLLPNCSQVLVNFLLKVRTLEDRRGLTSNSEPKVSRCLGNSSFLWDPVLEEVFYSHLGAEN